MSSFANFLQQATPVDAGPGPEAGFMPFTLDVAPLQRFLIHLAQKVEIGDKEREALRLEVSELKSDPRLGEVVEGLAELRDSVLKEKTAQAVINAEHRPVRRNSQMVSQHYYGAVGTPAASAAGGPAAGTPAAGGADTGGAAVTSGAGVAEALGDGEDVALMDGDFAGIDAVLLELKTRLAELERKAEIVGKVQEREHQLTASIARLTEENHVAKDVAEGTLGLAKASQQAAERLELAQQKTVEAIEKLQEKAAAQEAYMNTAREERQEMISNWETTQGQFWDQIRNVEATLSQRLATSETSVVSALQEVDEMKEISAELMQRVDEAKRHMGALEGKLESFNSQVAAAISPLHSSISAVNTRMAELAGTKLDISQAITEEDVNRAAARAVDHADRRCDGIVKSITGVEFRLESLTANKADRSDVVLLSDMQRILDDHDSGMDDRLAAMRTNIMAVVDIKADKEELATVNAQLCGRLAGLEQAILKGLKAISDKVAAALAEKLALSAFNEFKVQVRAVLADLEDRLRDWSPTGMATKSVAGVEGGGATTCLFCDGRVKSVKDLRALGFGVDDRVFSPEKLPTVDPWHPGAANAAPLGAYFNAKMPPGAGGTRRKESGSARLSESLPALPSIPDPSLQGGTASSDAFSSVQLPDGGRLSGGSGRKLDADTISGAIANGRVPNTRNKQAPRAKPGKLPNIDAVDQRPAGISGWTTDSAPPSFHVTSSGLEG